ncbi:hypothetical protein SAMD00019534_035000 [Acytostelium subglobosum LB1]|uniref:hypothetical protein n=1 Tax=Acytostelium subglobosum LB1 TaxID=1410327 RepID=UPI000644CEA1|nr:hypothetical protein SAMD00019534_035000 [Acytostelium subglobosum LB1]GAM20325.1 hypothetical protein SAMD00019534_035000 [Acytostelium subglobosum LB1]|eukprot:XP_012759846.1 hypothetical protein SAMD00019534_035000 [Acytostelium subglobosum LB1]
MTSLGYIHLLKIYLSTVYDYDFNNSNNNSKNILDHLQTPLYPVARIAAGRGYIDIIRMLLDIGIVFSGGEMAEAARAGHLNVVTLLQESLGSQQDQYRALGMAAEYGHIQVVQYLHNILINDNDTERPKPSSFDKMCVKFGFDRAAQHGHMDVIKFLHENRTEGCSTNAMIFAARNGHLEVIDYLHRNRTEGCSSVAVSMAILSRHLDVVKYLLANRTETSSTEAMSYAIRKGNLPVVQYLAQDLGVRPSTQDVIDAHESVLPFLQNLVGSSHPS